MNDPSPVLQQLLDRSSSKTFTGVGSRETPQPIGVLMAAISMKLTALGWELRSGGADGADLAFESGVQGADSNPARKQIFLPYPGFNGHQSKLHHLLPACFDRAAEVHPAWERCTDFAKKAHARNVFQVLGYNMMSPSTFLVCWTKDGAVDAASATSAGGTRTAIVLAERNNVPVFNLQRLEHRKLFEQWVGPDLLAQAAKVLVMKGKPKAARSAGAFPGATGRPTAAVAPRSAGSIPSATSAVSGAAAAATSPTGFRSARRPTLPSAPPAAAAGSTAGSPANSMSPTSPQPSTANPAMAENSAPTAGRGFRRR